MERKESHYYLQKLRKYQQSWHSRYGESEYMTPPSPPLSFETVVFSNERQNTTTAESEVRYPFPQGNIEHLRSEGYALEGDFSDIRTYPSGIKGFLMPVQPVYIREINTTVIVPKNLREN